MTVATNPSLRQYGLSLGLLCGGNRPFVATTLSKTELQKQKRDLQIKDQLVLTCMWELRGSCLEIKSYTTSLTIML